MTHNDSVIQQFLLIYDRNKDKLVEQKSFGTDIETATREYRAAEQMYHNQPEMDIALVGSDSIDTVKKTHSTYFEGFTRNNLIELMSSLNF